MSEMLKDVKILDLAHWVATPSACAMLADIRAEVVKVEHPETGDAVRSLNVSTGGTGTHTGGLNTVLVQLNRGKQSMGINLEVAEGQETVRSLAATVDVLVTNLTPRRHSATASLTKTSSPSIRKSSTWSGPTMAWKDRNGTAPGSTTLRSGRDRGLWQRLESRVAHQCNNALDSETRPFLLP